MADVGVRRIEVALEEYKALRAEIDRRSREQHTLLALNLTASATISGIALSPTADARSRVALALLVPVISSAFALVWLDHDRVIAKIGAYLDGRLTSSLRALAGHGGILGWSGGRDEARHELLARLALTATYGTVFTFLPALVLLYLNPFDTPKGVPRPDGPAEALWGVGSALVALLLIRWIVFLLRPWLPRWWARLLAVAGKPRGSRRPSGPG